MKLYTPNQGITIVRYVDDLLIAGKSKESVREESIKLLNFLSIQGLKVSKSKLQFVEEEVKYLGHRLSKGTKTLDPERVKGILSLPPPRSKRQIRQLLGLVGYCRQWIDNFSGKVKFLYEKLTAEGLMKWTKKDDESLEQLKNELANAPVLSLPDVRRPFYLFVNTEAGVAYGVLTQDWASSRKPVAFISKLLDPVSRGWPTCLQIIVATALLVEEALKITYGGKLKVFTPHNIRAVLQQKAEKWITDSRLLKYEGILLSSPRLKLETTSLQNPAEFLFGDPRGNLTHDCLHSIEKQTKIRPDLEEEELEGGGRLFVDGSSRVVGGKRVSGYAIVGGDNLEIIESEPLSPSWSAQACELYAVLRALKLLEDKVGTIYTDSKYAFGVVHTFGKIWEERGLINSRGRELIHQELITQVLQALRGPKKIAVVHVKGHQKGLSHLIRGNNTADREAKEAALRKFKDQEIRRMQYDEKIRVLSFTAQEKEKLDKMGIKENGGI